MPEQSDRSQKDIALAYGGSNSKSFLDGRLDYFRRGHWFRRFRLVIFVVAVVCSIGLVFGYSRLVGPNARAKWNDEMKKRIDQSLAKGEKIAAPWNPEELFNTGPISENHSRLAAGCQACHWGSNPDLARLIGVGKAMDKGSVDDKSTFGKLSIAWKSEGTKGMVGAYQKLSKLEQMDLACITCHVDYQQLPVHLHLPQAAQLHLAQASFPFAIVGSGACSNCHKEHEGHSGERPRRMAEVGSETCAQCHNGHGSTAGTSEVLDILKDPRRGRVAFPIGKTPVHGSMTMNLGEGLRRFLVWRAPGETAAFDANWSKPFRYYGPENPRDKQGPGFAGHPPFRYEMPNARDPGRIRYGHMQHEQPRVMNFVKANAAEISRIRKEASEANGVAIQEWLNTDNSQNCMFCHEPGPDREYRQQVKFDINCKACHQMNLVIPWLRNKDTGAEYRFETRIEIPHRDPEKVRAFLDPPSIMIELDRSAFRAGMTDAATRRGYVDSAIGSITSRGIQNQMDILKRVFYLGEPPTEAWRNSPTTNRAHTDCAFCHKDMLQPASVEQYTDVSHAPVMLPINLTDRWVNHGPFTHEPHKHMKCGDCHASEEAVKDWRTGQPVLTADYQQDASGAKQQAPMTYSVGNAHKSRITADILMPRQRLCAECHRPMPPEAAAKLAAQGGPNGGAWNIKAQAPQERVDFQRGSGGIKYECLDCHKFHAPSEAIPFKEQLLRKDAPLPKMAEATVK